VLHARENWKRATGASTGSLGPVMIRAGCMKKYT
jgi:hypothetical protein